MVCDEHWQCLVSAKTPSVFLFFLRWTLISVLYPQGGGPGRTLETVGAAEPVTKVSCSVAKTKTKMWIHRFIDFGDKEPENKEDYYFAMGNLNALLSFLLHPTDAVLRCACYANALLSFLLRPH